MFSKLRGSGYGVSPDPFTPNVSLSVVHICLKPRRALLSLAAIIMAGSAAALDTREPAIELVRLASPAILIDGMLEENEWQGLPEFKNFRKLSPATLAKTPFETRVRMFYSDKGIYIGIQADQPSDSLIERLSSRDQFITRDGFSIILDPSGEGLYAYWFAINLGNSLGDGMVLPERQFSRQWDGPWRGATARNDAGYAAEYFLPFSMIAMPELDHIERRMGVYIMRRVGHKSEFWGWPALPDTQPKFLSALQPIILDNFKPKRQFTFYPYAAVNYDAIENEIDLKSGFDVFWRPSSNLQLTAAVRPDFGNIESDDVVVNLTSVETFFPEKRPLFLEGQEIFTTTPRAQSRGRGTPTILVNTRRIGSPLVVPPIDNFEVSDVEANRLTELIGAAKVTGQKNGWRYGLLTAIEDDTKIKGRINNHEIAFKADGRTFGAARLLYESTAGGVRRGLGWISTMVNHSSGDAKVHGIDGHFLSADGSWNVDGQLLYSDVEDSTGLGGFADITYAPIRGHKHRLALNYFDEDLDINDLGFMRRNDVVTARYNYELTQSDLPGLKKRETSLTLSQEHNTDGLVVRSGIFFSQEREFANNSRLDTELSYFPSRWDDLSSRNNGSFRINSRWQAGASWGSDNAKPFQANLGFFLKDEYLKGTQRSYEIELNWRPSDRFSAHAFIVYRKRTDWLVHYAGRDLTTFAAEYWRPRFELDYFVSAKQQFRVILQWVGVKAAERQRWRVPDGDGSLVLKEQPHTNNRDFSISNVSFQARYRWEIAPLSDLFLVYTRGSNLTSRPGESFSELLHDGWTEREADSLAIKLRYRIGN